LTFDSELELSTLRAVAKRAELPEPVVLDCIRDHVYDLRAEVAELRRMLRVARGLNSDFAYRA
jgi:hypothetical protein